MTRPDGFQIADVDVGLLTDPKFRRLWRELHDQPLMTEAVVLYVATLLESWDAGERMPVEQAMPMWLDPSDEALEALRKVGLLDGQGLVSETGWASWFGPASARREHRRTSGRAGGLAKAGSSDATADPEAPLTLPSVRPSVTPSDPPAKRDRLGNEAPLNGLAKP